MPRALRAKIEREQTERGRQRARRKRLWTLGVLGLVVALIGGGCIVSAVLGLMAGGLQGGVGPALLGAAASGLSGAGVGAFILVTVLPVPIIFSAIAVFGGQSSHESFLRDSGFAVELLDLLDDDLLPGKKISAKLNFSGRSTGLQKMVGRSAGGHAKYRYEDRWFELSAVLVDGTRIRIRRWADVKTKRGGVIKHKRRLDLTIKPVRSVVFDPELLQEAGTDAVRDAFHDPPERLKVRAVARGGAARVSVLQEDAPFLAAEVVALAESVLAAAMPAEPQASS